MSNPQHGVMILVCQVDDSTLKNALQDWGFQTKSSIVTNPSYNSTRRKRSSSSGVSGKRSRAGRFLHYFQSQGFHLKDSTLAQMCNSFNDSIQTALFTQTMFIFIAKMYSDGERQIYFLPLQFSFLQPKVIKYIFYHL